MQIKFSPESIEDLKRLYEFIAQHNPDAAQTASLNLKSAIQRFAKFPFLGHGLESLDGVREFIFVRYAIRYLVKDDTVYVLRIWHGKEER